MEPHRKKQLIKIRNSFVERYKLAKQFGDKFYTEYFKKQVKDIDEEFCLELIKKNKKQQEIIDKVKDILIIKKSRCLNENDYILNVTDLDDIRAILEDKEV